MSKFMVMIGLCLSLSALAQADGMSDWRHITRSFGGMNLSVDYRVGCYTYSLGTACTANPVWINLYGANPNSRVQAVLMNHCGEGAAPEFHRVDLAYDGSSGKFTADIPYGLKTRVNGCWQELAVVVNGVWSTQANSGRNFILDMMNGR